MAATSAQSGLPQRGQEVRAAQVRLLYANTSLNVGVTIIACTILGRLQWGFVPNAVVLRWWAYMALVSAGRYAVARRFRAASPGIGETGVWSTRFAIGAGL